MAKAKKAKKMSRAMSKPSPSAKMAKTTSRGLPSPLARIGGALGGVTSQAGARAVGGRRRSKRMTPERLQRAILILKLKRKLSRLKYGGR